MSSSKSKVSSPVGVTSLSGLALLSLLAMEAGKCNRIFNQYSKIKTAAADLNPELDLFKSLTESLKPQCLPER